MQEAINTRSIGEAAKRLGMTQPAVSQHIARFERLLGVSIIARKGNQMVVREGAVVDFVRAISEAREMLSRRVSDSAETKARLGICASLGLHFVSSADRLGDLIQKFSIYVIDSASLHSLFNAGGLDGIIFPVSASRDHADTTFEVPHVWVATRKWDASLPVFPAVISSPLSSHGEVIRAMLADRGMRLHVAVHADDYSSRIVLAQKGVGATLVPVSAVPLLPEDLHPVPMEGDRHFNLTYSVRCNTKVISESSLEGLMGILGAHDDLTMPDHKRIRGSNV
ncbi:LysR family transcriptional regulator [Pelagibacterium halotolerans]|uniref:LysR family transcriptional regulator n=1 Tax=Pelagibacterium halotolerans TaxID=531813 RepID=UPI00384AA9BA